MKKVILLFVAVMFSSVLMAHGNGNGPWGPQKGHNDASIVQLGNWNKAYVDQTDASKSYATIAILGAVSPAVAANGKDTWGRF